MKHKTHFLYYLFYPRGLMVIALLLCNTVTTAQEQTSSPNEFPIATTIFDTLITNPDLLNSFKATGFNTIWQRADNSTKGLLQDYNLFAVNADTLEYIYYYSTSYYSKWEAEQNQTDQSRVGIKHLDSLGNALGDTATWKGELCWSTKGLTEPASSLMYGPHYRQEKRYKRWHYGCTSGDGCLTYTPRFRMALDNPTSVDSSENVCKIKVVFRYKDNDEIGEHHDTTFIERTLKVGDFDTAGNYDDFYLHPDPSLGRYEYFPNFILPKDFALMESSSSAVDYIDWESFTGIQFCVDWLRADTLCTLYIDYTEVYDNSGWNDFMGDSLTADQTIQNIKTYAQSFSNWDNLKYWVGANEPYTIDSYTPIHIVDSLIQEVGAPPLVVHFDPTWWHTLDVNGEDEIDMFYNIAKPDPLNIHFFPFNSWNVPSSFVEVIKNRFSNGVD